MRLKLADIEHIIELIEQITNALTKSDFLTAQEQQRLDLCLSYERIIETINDVRRARGVGVRELSEAEKQEIKAEYYYDPNVLQELKCKLSKAQTEHVQSTLSPLQKKLDLYLAPRGSEISAHTTQGSRLKQEIERYFLKQTINPVMNNTIISKKAEVINELQRIKARLEYNQEQSPDTTETEQKPTPAKRRGIRACLKGLAKELYGLTIERITKAYLDKYG